MEEAAARPSAPMSPLPPAPDEAEHPHRRRTDSIAGWVPADEDEGMAATAWRAKKALSRTTRQDTAIAALTTSVNELNATMGRVAGAVKWIGGPLVLAILADLGHTLWRIVAAHVH